MTKTMNMMNDLNERLFLFLFQKMNDLSSFLKELEHFEMITYIDIHDQDKLNYIIRIYESMYGKTTSRAQVIHEIKELFSHNFKIENEEEFFIKNEYNETDTYPPDILRLICEIYEGSCEEWKLTFYIDDEKFVILLTKIDTNQYKYIIVSHK